MVTTLRARLSNLDTNYLSKKATSWPYIVPLMLLNAVVIITPWVYFFHTGQTPLDSISSTTSHPSLHYLASFGFLKDLYLATFWVIIPIGVTSSITDFFGRLYRREEIRLLAQSLGLKRINPLLVPRKAILQAYQDASGSATPFYPLCLGSSKLWKPILKANLHVLPSKYQLFVEQALAKPSRLPSLASIKKKAN